MLQLYLRIDDGVEPTLLRPTAAVARVPVTRATFRSASAPSHLLGWVRVKERDRNEENSDQN